MKSKAWAALLAIVALPALAAVPARPGMLNFVEGQADIGERDVAGTTGGSVILNPGQTLATKDGHAEVLLTPGVFLRLNKDTAVKMISPGLIDTRVEVLRGQAMVEATEVKKENNLRVLNSGATTQIEKEGLYRFDADRNLVAVYDGKAVVQEDDKTVDLKGGRAALLSTDQPLKAVKFDKNSAEDELYKWSKLRSEYLAEANAASARIYVAGNAGWYGPGWYWNPWYSAYTFIPGSGILYSPFGWGFASPWAYPFYGGFYGSGYWGRPIIIGRRPVHRTPIIGPRQGPAPVFRPGINPGLSGRGGAHYTGPRGR